MFGIIDLSTYLLGVIFIVLIPGPNSLYILGLAIQYGTRFAYLGACGVFLGDIILMVLSAVGTTSLLHTHPRLFMLFKMIGAAYLAWMGFKLLSILWSQHTRSDTAQITQSFSRTTVYKNRPFTKALLISLLNPKAILFFISFFIQFVSPDYPYPFISFVVLGLILQIVSVIYLSLLIFLGARLATVFSRQYWLVVSTQIMAGILFMGFAVKLAMANLN